MEASLPAELAATYTSDWDGHFDGQALTRNSLAAAGYGLFSWQIESSNEWWGRPLKAGEVGCSISHLACWQHAQLAGCRFALVLEDDAVLGNDFLARLLLVLGLLDGQYDLLYLGRVPLTPDVPFGRGVVEPGYSHCTFGYVLTSRGIDVALSMRFGEDLVPVDEFLPCLYVDHPRPDLRARYPRSLRALALDPALVTQRPKVEAGSDTEDSVFL